MTGKAQTVTILFTDLVNSTELLQRAGDDLAQRIFKTHHRLLGEAVAAHSGHEVKWLGDGLMVAFDSARDAVRCAVAMQQASRRPAAGERLEIRAGLNVGEALRDETDYFGSAVVIARRLCDKAQAGQIIASDLVARLLGGRQDHAFDDLGALALKGITAPVHAHEVRYEHDPLAMLTLTPFVGRGDEIATLSKKLEEARAGRGSLVTLVGEPGIGKTRTAEEFCDLARSTGATVLWGRCYDGEWAAPFSPFVEAVRQYATAADEASLRVALAGDTAALARLVPLLRERLPGLVDPPPLPEESERYRLLEAMTSFLSAIAGQALVLVLDDLHWADAATLAMLRHVARETANRKIVLLATYRDVEVDAGHPLSAALTDLRRQTSFERISLAGLPAEDVGRLIDLIAEQDVPETLTDAIARETGGNPFFVREVLLHLVDEGKIIREDGRWTSSLSVAEMGIPEGAREVIRRRLGRLSPECNRMLTAASAMTGGVTWAELRAIAPDPEAVLLDALDEALAAQVVREIAPSTYDFAHALIRHTLYEELSSPRRALLHRQIGDALVQLDAADTERRAAELAHHFFHGAEGAAVDAALGYVIAAGDAAFAAIAYEDGMLQFGRALTLIDREAVADERLRIEVMLKLARARFAAGLPSLDSFIATAEQARDAEAFDLMARALLRDPFPGASGARSASIWPAESDRMRPLLDEVLQRLPEEALALRACSLAYRSYLSVVEDAERARALSREAEKIARSLGDPATLVYVLYWSQWALWSEPAGRRRQLDVATEFLSLARETEERQLVRAGHMWRVFCLMSLGDPAMDEDLDIFHRTSGEFRIRQLTWWSTTCVVMRTLMKGEFAEAERLMSHCLAFARDATTGPTPETGDAADITASFGMQLFQLRNDQGRLAEVEPLVKNAVEQSPENPAWRTAFARACVASGRIEDARRELGIVLAHGSRPLRSTPFFEITLPLLVDLCADLDERQPAPELYESLLPYQDLMLYVAWRVPLGAADRLLGLLATMMDRFDDAQDHFERALEIHARMSARPWLARTQFNYAGMLLRRDAPGDREHARDLLHPALGTARDLGMPLIAADCERLLASIG